MIKVLESIRINFWFWRKEKLHSFLTGISGLGTSVTSRKFSIEYCMNHLSFIVDFFSAALTGVLEGCNGCREIVSSFPVSNRIKHHIAMFADTSIAIYLPHATHIVIYPYFNKQHVLVTQSEYFSNVRAWECRGWRTMQAVGESPFFASALCKTLASLWQYRPSWTRRSDSNSCNTWSISSRQLPYHHRQDRSSSASRNSGKICRSWSWCHFVGWSNLNCWLALWYKGFAANRPIVQPRLAEINHVSKVLSLWDIEYEVTTRHWFQGKRNIFFLPLFPYFWSDTNKTPTSLGKLTTLAGDASDCHLTRRSIKSLCPSTCKYKCRYTAREREKRCCKKIP